MQNQQTIPQTEQKQPLVSFIVTAYNLPTIQLQECLESIAALPLSDNEREILLVDDGSETSPMSSLTAWQDCIIYLRQQHGGLSQARNNGLRIATGSYVQFVDGDDRLLKTPYSQCLNWLKDHDTDILLFALSDSPTTKEAGNINIAGPVTGAAYMHNNNLHASACGYLFKKAMLDNLRFTPGIFHEDEEFTPLLLLKADLLYHTTAPAYYYRPRNASITHNSDDAHIQKRLDDMCHIIYRLRKTSATIPEPERVALNRRIAQFSMDYLYQTIALTHSSKTLNAAIAHLEAIGLFPLPDKAYTKKYSMFRRLVANPAGRRLLLTAIR